MEKEKKNNLFEKRESETENETKGIEKFLTGKLSFVPEKYLMEKDPKELFAMYKEYMDQEPNFENFKKWSKIENLKPEDIKNNKELENKYRRYLLEKLPLELQKRQKEISKGEEIPIERLEGAHQYREKNGYRTILGYHCSNNEFGDVEGRGVIKPGSQTEVFEDKNYSGLTFYSVDYKQLYGGKSRYLYLLEGDTNDLKRPREADTERWVFHHGPLQTIHRIKLTNEIKKELGINFVEF